MEEQNEDKKKKKKEGKMNKMREDTRKDKELYSPT